MKTLAKLPSWVAHAKEYPEYSARLIEAGNKFSVRIDEAVFSTVMRGKRPRFLHRWRVSNAEKNMTKIYHEFQALEKKKG